MGDEGGGSLISPDGVALSRIVGVSASDISPCTIKFRRSFLLPPAHPGFPGKRAVKRFVCVSSESIAMSMSVCLIVCLHISKTAVSK